MIRVKICGITNKEDALKAVYYGAWALGFIFYRKSPRYISPSRVRKIVEQLPPFVTPVGVFVNPRERELHDVCHFTRIQTVQLHGDEDATFCKRLKNYKIIKAFRVSPDFDFAKIANYKVDAYLFDTFKDDQYGGTGEVFSWDLLKDKKWDRPVILSGGLSADNIQDAVTCVHPFAVDVSSSLEKSPGVKDPALIRAFFKSMSLVPS